MFRVLLTAGFLALGSLVLLLSVYLGAEGTSGALLLNLGTEILGIVLTIAIVDWLFERRRRSADARAMAWEVLHSIDELVWVWQGGKRELNVDELLALLDVVGQSDPIAHFTEDLLMDLGTRSGNTLRLRQEITEASADLKQALETLTALTSIRDTPNRSSQEVGAILREATLALVRYLGQETLTDSRQQFPLERDPDPKRQEWRRFGKVIGE
jgi:hypothetical protein